MFILRSADGVLDQQHSVGVPLFAIFVTRKGYRTSELQWVRRRASVRFQHYFRSQNHRRACVQPAKGHLPLADGYIRQIENVPALCVAEGAIARRGARVALAARAVAAAARRAQGDHVPRLEEMLDLRLDGFAVDLDRSGCAGFAAADALGGNPRALGRREIPRWASVRCCESGSPGRGRPGDALPRRSPERACDAAREADSASP